MRTVRTKAWPRLLLTLALAGVPSLAFAQPGKLELQHLEKLSDKAAEVNDVTLDGALLQMAGKFLDASGDPDAAQAKEVIKGLKGIYVKSFEFDEPNQYSPADVEAIRSQLARPGWTRIVESTSRRKHEAEHDEIYLFKEGDTIAGMAILVAEAKELTVVNIVGVIDFEKLGALAGKFGVPEDLKEKPAKPKSKTPAPSKPDKKEDSHDDAQDNESL